VGRLPCVAAVWAVLVLAGAVSGFAQEPQVAVPALLVPPLAAPPVVPPPLVPPLSGDPRLAPGRRVATGHEMLHKYVWSTLGLDGAIHATLMSGLAQWRERPPEWGTGGTGYARRWASEYAESAIGDTAKYTVARIFHQDPAFTRCECEGLGRRLAHALDAPFMARKRNGVRVFSVASLAGVVTGQVVSASTWYPAPRGARDGLKHAGVSLVTKMGVDVFKEFRPRRAK
jgi:hypothetical protein